MRADLHVHSVYSDGAHSPEELALFAKQKGVQLISVTDHDSFIGDDEKRKAFTGMGISYLTGVEISAYQGKTKVHITGYGYDAASPLCKAYHAERVLAADKRLDDVLQKLRFYKNISLSKESVYRQLKVKDIPVHTMHVVRALVEEGRFSSVQKAFQACFLPHSPTYSFLFRPTPQQAIDIIHSLGGIACIAHPGRISLPFAEREKLIYSLQEQGVDGIECVYSTHTAEQTEYFSGLAHKLKLFISGGSDFHAKNTSREIGKPYFEPSESFLQATHVRK